MSHILIAEDETRISDFIEKGLRAAGFVTTAVADGGSALALARSDMFDLLILDLGLPTLDGFTVLRRLREEGSCLPVVILSARDAVPDRVAGLEGGANDYVVKPFAFGELLARVRLRLGDSGPPATGSTIEAAGLRLDLRTRRVTLLDPDAEAGGTAAGRGSGGTGRTLAPGDSADLTAREFTLLEMFMRHPDQVLTREQVLGEVWGLDFDPGSNVVDVFVRTLRAKIGAHRIETVRGVGYRLRGRP